MAYTLLQYGEALDKLQMECGETASANLDHRLQVLAQYGPAIGAPYTKHLRKGIYECRGSSGARLLYFVLGERLIFVHGFVKKKSKVDGRHIDKAERIRDAITQNPELLNDATQIH